jgi:hypothetical protein
MKAPTNFKGHPKEDFRSQFQTINRYIRYYKYQFPRDQDKIDWLGNRLEIDAQHVYEGRYNNV